MKGLTRTFPACAVRVLIGRAAVTGPRKDQVRTPHPGGHAILGCTVHKRRSDSTNQAYFSGKVFR